MTHYLHTPGMFLRIHSATAAVCAAILLLLHQTAAVRHRVPDGKSGCCSSLNLIPVFYSSSYQLDPTCMHPLAVLSHLRPRLTYCSIPWVVAGMRGAKGAISPPRRRQLGVYIVE